jgi:predicted MFS family arabinose efflux permease
VIDVASSPARYFEWIREVGRQLRLLANPDINRLAAHTAIHQLAGSVSGTFVSVFLLREQLAPAEIFLCVAGIFVLRFLLRPLVRFAVPVVGLRRLLILGAMLLGLQYPVLASVHGPGPALALYALTAALADIFYWPSYHLLFATLGDANYRGSHLGATQALGTIAAVLGPAAGGIALATVGSWPAFGASALIELAGTLPLLGLSEPRIARSRSPDASAFARATVLLIFTNGWISGCSGIAWDIVAFRALSERYEVFGGTLSAAGFAGVVGGVILGRLIDRGRAHYAVWINAAACAGILMLKSLAGTDPVFVVFVAIVAAVLGGFYTPSLATAYYNQIEASTHPLRFELSAEGGFDTGAILGCLIGAAAAAWSVPLQAVIFMALPAVAIQARLLSRLYAGGRRRSEDGGTAESKDGSLLPALAPDLGANR